MIRSKQNSLSGRLRSGGSRIQSGCALENPEWLAALVAVPGIDVDQFQRMQQRAGFRDELDVSAFGAGKNGVPVAVSVGHETDAHQLITFKFLLTAQAADSLLIGIVKKTPWGVDGWFHIFNSSLLLLSALSELYFLERAAEGATGRT